TGPLNIRGSNYGTEVGGNWLMIDTTSFTGAPAVDLGTAADKGDLIFGGALAGGTLNISALSGAGKVRTDTGGTGVRTLAINQASDTVFSGGFLAHVSGGGAVRDLDVIKTGAGVLELTGTSGKQTTSSGAGDPTLNLIVNGGTIRVSGAGDIGPASVTNVSIGAAGTFEWDTTSGIKTIANDISGTGALLKSGPNNLVLQGSNSFSGAATVTGGFLVFDSLTAEDGAPSVALNGGSLALGSSFAGNTATIGSLSGTTGTQISPNFGATTGVKTLQVNQTVDGTYAGVIGGGTGSRDLAIVKNGLATLTLSGANNFGGTTTVNAGTLRIGNKNALGAFQGGRPVTQVVVASGGAVDFNGVVDATYGYTIAGAGPGGAGALVNLAGPIGNNFAQTSNILLSADATIGGTGDWSLLTNAYNATSLDLAGFTLTKAGANTISLVNTTTTAGTVNIAGGTLALGGSPNGAGADASLAAFTLNNTAGASLLVNKNSSIGSLAGGGGSGGNVAIGGAATLTVGAIGSNTSYAGVISGGGNLIKTGVGTLELTNTNTYTGATTVSNGVLKASANGALGSAAAGTTVNNGASLELAGGLNYTTAEALSLNGAGFGAPGSTGALFIDDGGSAAFAGPIAIATDATIGAFNGSTLTLGGSIDKNGTTVTFLGNGSATNTININGGVTGTLPNSDLIVDNVTTNLNSLAVYAGPTFVRNAGVLNVNATGDLSTTAITLGDSGTGDMNQIAGSNVFVSGGAGVGDLLVNPGSTYSLAGGTLDFGDTNAGTQEVGVGSGNGASVMQIDGAFNFTGGTLINVSTINQATFTQQGGDFVIGVDGGLDVNDANLTRALTTINGDFNQTGGSLSVDIFGNTVRGRSGEAGDDFFNVGDPLTYITDSDLLYVTGSATLDGSVDVQIASGVERQPWCWYDVVYANAGITLGGSFSVNGGAGIYRILYTPDGQI
ncbi:MAG: autotransporter-associated beta strand repeat-containing protein, partial [Planctomycetales bacterium]|nr:autotransporter-associated beta strand repeat-containing protein [Planctomycetales bacterium]